MAPAFWDVLSQGEAGVVGDVKADLRTAQQTEAYAAMGVAAFVTVPYVQDKRCPAVLSVIDGAPRVWRPDEVSLLRDVIARTWPLIEKRASIK